MFRDLDQFLQQFDEVTIDLSSQKYPTIAHLRIILIAIKKDLEFDKRNGYFLENVKAVILEKFNKYYELLKESSHIAAFLDSRYKNYCFPEISDYEIQNYLISAEVKENIKLLN